MSEFSSSNPDVDALIHYHNKERHCSEQTLHLLQTLILTIAHVLKQAKYSPVVEIYNLQPSTQPTQTRTGL